MIGAQVLARYGAVLMLAAGAAAPSGARPAVVELYTSQGCSSCPPADALLGEIAQRADVLALAFHVDYWDDLGWRDPFSLPAARQRQLDYVRHFGNDWVYTPDMVIDGHIDVLRVDRRDLLRQLATPRSGVPVHVAVQGADLLISVEAATGALSGDVFLVSYLPTALTPIGRGENAGRELREFNIVRSFATAWPLAGLGRPMARGTGHTASRCAQGRGAGAAARARTDPRGSECGAAALADPAQGVGLQMRAEPHRHEHGGALEHSP